MNRFEPPLCRSSLVLIGRNSRGQWVAQEHTGLFGGLFKSRVAALRYALFENGHRPEAIVETADFVELDMSALLSPAVEPIAMPQRRVA